MLEKWLWAALVGVGLSLVLDFVPILVPRLAGWGLASSALSLLLVAGLLPTYRRERTKMAVERAGVRDGLWATLADGLSRLAAGNLIWTLKAPDTPIDTLAQDCILAFNDVTAEPCRRLFYVGSDSQEEGQIAGQVIGERLRKGRLAVFVGSLDGINYELRRKGALTVLREHYPDIQESALLESRVDPEHGYLQAKKLLAADPHLGAIYVTEGGSPPGVARAVDEAGRTGQVLVFAHDLTAGTMAAMENGGIEATVFQDPFAQGYDPSVRIHNYLNAGESPPTSRLSTQLRSVTQNNAEELWDFRHKKSLPGDVSRLVAPVPSRGRALRIAVIGLADDGFWAEVKVGALAAKEALSPLGTSVEWMVPPGADEPERISHLSKTIQDIVDAKYDGMALPLHDRALVPVVNRAVAAGVVVGTYNTEPLSLRQTMATVAVQAKHQRSLSVDLDGLAQAGEQSAERIKKSLSAVAEGLGRQKGQVSETVTGLETLGESLRTIDTSARTSVEATRRVAQSAEESFKTVQETLGAMGGLDTASRAIAQSVHELKEETARIAENVNFIGDIANRTNTLAINASIEAARAGSTGRGFAVIASEIRHLSDQANAAAKSISDLLESIGNKVDHVETTTQTALEGTHRTHESALMSGRALGVIVEASSESDLKMGEILSAVQNVVSFNAQIETVVKDLSETNKVWDAAVGESMSAAGEMTRAMEKIVSDAHTLSDRSRSQEGMLRQFKLGDE